MNIHENYVMNTASKKVSFKGASLSMGGCGVFAGVVCFPAENISAILICDASSGSMQLLSLHNLPWSISNNQATWHVSENLEILPG